MSTPAGDRDPGLQPERTRLAWRRTTLSGTVAAVLAAKAALHTGKGVGLTAVAVSSLLWLGFLALAHLRIHALATAAPGHPPRLTARHAAGATLCTIALAVCAVALLF
ncbi:Inner membrane protein YidG [Streptomyces sp. MBT84]|jgi:uncharacterized membrane protein YidH (DUF202 family)|uniref:DUF202 domain-containing protein n=1 Tax=unclassified Streptomyces TaxID=2593676 RepID=UPI000740D1F9|nr:MULTISPECIES: DUF202 domain-containing protein [unclassified Streptomyces]KUJ58938.1 hypothetical protein ADL25_01615 [Streptomyces sp. NRRL F-5122]MBW8704557.1 Inner membrane protein YidG [Streptomyces sp. MBT84]MDX3259186.1 DUF202 domain-containing protein [Streptomyces sp. MI02-2A]REE59696.1 uncharacterized protein DUF202 [Streptomyces sp. 3212.3]